MNTISNRLKQNALSFYNDILSQHLNSEGDIVLLNVFGNLDPSKINSLINLVEQIILENGIKRKVMKRVCTVLIENFQNIHIHGSRDSKGNHNSLFVLVKRDNELLLHSGNMVHIEDIGPIDYKLAQINKLSMEEIRKLYIETLCNESFSDKGGAGLGFLTIAKKVHHPIAYNISPLDDEHSYFTSELTISTVID